MEEGSTECIGVVIRRALQGEITGLCPHMRRRDSEVEGGVGKFDVNGGTPHGRVGKGEGQGGIGLGKGRMRGVINEIEVVERVPGQSKGIFEFTACVRWQPYIRHGRVNQSENALREELLFAVGVTISNLLEANYKLLQRVTGGEHESDIVRGEFGGIIAS